MVRAKTVPASDLGQYALERDAEFTRHVENCEYRFTGGTDTPNCSHRFDDQARDQSVSGLVENSLLLQKARYT